MDEPFFPGVVQRAGDLARHAQRESHVPRAAVLEQDRTAAEVFHRDVVIVAGAADIVDADDMAVMQARSDLRFAQEAFAEFGSASNAGDMIFSATSRSTRFLHGQIDRCHAAAAELAQKSVTGNLDHVRVMSALENRPVANHASRHRVGFSG